MNLKGTGNGDWGLGTGNSLGFESSKKPPAIEIAGSYLKSAEAYCLIYLSAISKGFKPFAEY
ncbi:hypothetical protein NIES4106_04840 [Fischerella sp. NIES-4106]|nr:hypothetical protein NIES4106_04840 [Fischerella sp. NIES-4106]